MADSKLDLVVAGTSRAVLMVESEADRLPEDVMLGAVSFGHQQMQVAIEAINSLVEEAGKPAWDWQPPAKNEALIARIRELAFDGLKAAYDIRQKQPRSEKIRAVYELVHETLKKDAEAAITATIDAITDSLKNGEKVQLVGFGSFEVKARAERVGRNPLTKETIQIPASKTPVFKAGKALKDAVSK